MRGSPLLLLLFLVYYGGPSLGVTLDAITVGVLGLGFYGAGFYAEIFRAGMASVPPGQVEAARVLGFPSSSILTRIEIPQMLPLIIPPMAGQAIVILKESSVLSIITVGDLTKITTQISNETFTVTAPFLLAALMYWLAAESISTVGRVLARSFTSPGLRP
jgi:polar amino acid transport system permease protein